MAEMRQEQPESRTPGHCKTSHWAAAMLCFVCANLGGCGSDELQQHDERVQQAWHLVDQYYSARITAGARALAAVDRAPGFDRGAYSAAATALRSASALPHDAALTNDPRVFDRYKQAHGELTGALFRLLAAARSDSATASHPSIRGLEATLTREVAQLQEARDNYRRQIAEYNALLETFPTRVTAVALGFKPKQDFVHHVD